MLAQALLSFRRWGDETKQAGRFFAVFAALLAELTIDNAFTWYYLCKLARGVFSTFRRPEHVRSQSKSAQILHFSRVQNH